MLLERKHQIWQNVKLTDEMGTRSAVSARGRGFARTEPAPVSSTAEKRTANLQSLEFEPGKNNKPQIYKSIGNQVLFCFNT